MTDAQTKRCYCLAKFQHSFVYVDQSSAVSQNVTCQQLSPKTLTWTSCDIKYSVDLKIVGKGLENCGTLRIYIVHFHYVCQGTTTRNSGHPDDTQNILRSIERQSQRLWLSAQELHSHRFDGVFWGTHQLWTVVILKGLKQRIPNLATLPTIYLD